jgi:allantoinase
MQLDGGQQMISIPYTFPTADKGVFEYLHATADDFREIICRQFDVLYREGKESGRLLTLGLHPYVIGQPFRIGALEAILEYVCRHDGVWFPTGEEIAAHIARASA